jgi:hypothetical protein
MSGIRPDSKVKGDRPFKKSAHRRTIQQGYVRHPDVHPDAPAGGGGPGRFRGGHDRIAWGQKPPPGSQRPPAKSPTADHFGQFTLEQLNAAGIHEWVALYQQLPSILGGMPAKIRVQLGPMITTTELLRDAAGVIAAKKVRLYSDDDNALELGARGAKYFYEPRAFVFGPGFSVNDLYSKGAFVHETTHMLHQHRRVAAHSKLDEEVVGWVTQAWYYRGQGYKESTFPGVTARGRAVLEAAFSFADFLRAHDYDAAKEPMDPARFHKLAETLRSELATLPEYTTARTTSLDFSKDSGF